MAILIYPFEYQHLASISVIYIIYIYFKVKDQKLPMGSKGNATVKNTSQLKYKNLSVSPSSGKDVVKEATENYLC